MAGMVYKNAKLTMATVDVGPQLNQISINQSRPVINWEVFQAEAAAQDIGSLKSQVRVTGVYTTGAAEAAATFRALIASGASAAMVIYPDGNTSGKQSISGTVYVSGNNAVLPRTSQGTIDVTLEVDGALTWGTV